MPIESKNDSQSGLIYCVDIILIQNYLQTQLLISFPIRVSLTWKLLSHLQVQSRKARRIHKNQEGQNLQEGFVITYL